MPDSEITLSGIFFSKIELLAIFCAACYNKENFRRGEVHMSENIWGDYRLEEFEFQGRKAAVVFPETPDLQRRWAIYTEYFGAFPSVALGLLAKGYHIAYVANRHRWGDPEDQHLRRDFCEYLAREYGLARRCVPIGMSCGGLHAIHFAAAHPECVSVLYLDAPVVNLLSIPMAFGTADRSQDMIDECLTALGLTAQEMLVYRRHPLDDLPAVLAQKIPVVLVCGDADSTVPYDENGIYVDRAWHAAGCDILTILKPGVAHHPHGLDDPEPIVDFILAHDK